MMKHLLFTGAIALSTMFAFAQTGGRYQNNGQNTTGQQSGNTKNGAYQQAATVQTPQQNTGAYNTQQTNNTHNQNATGYQTGRMQQPSNADAQNTNLGNYQQQRQPDPGFQQPQRGFEHNGYDRRYQPVYRQAQRNDYRYEPQHGRGHYDEHGNYCY